MNHNDIKNTIHYNGWRKDSGQDSFKLIPKGSNPLTEHYSVINKNIKEEQSINGPMNRLLDELDSHDRAEKDHTTFVLAFIDVQQNFIIPEPQEFEIDIEYYLNTKKVMHTKTVTIKAFNRAEADSILRTQYTNLTKIDFK